MSKNILYKIDLKSIVSIGLDVSKNKIDICLHSNEKNFFLQIKNNETWISNLISWLKNNNFNQNIPLVIESTWDYSTLACMLLSKANFNVKEINPIITKNYTKSTIRWIKTDKIDANILANIWALNKNELFSYNKTKAFIAISKKISLVANLEKQIQSLKMTIKSFYEINQKIHLDISSNVKNINISISKLEDNIKNLQKEIQEESIWKVEDKKIELICSITGFSKYIATVSYVSFAHKDFVSKESMYAFVWYDPKLKESGTFNWKARITKRWNPYVRKKLFQAAFCATRHSKLFKGIYDRAREKWKHHFVCVINVVKKMIHILFALLKNNSVFNPNFAKI